MKNPLTIVIFGATGDLYQNKLAPALFDLFCTGSLPSRFNIIGFARRPFSNEEFQQMTRDFIVKNKTKQNKKYDTEKLESFIKLASYNQGDLDNLQSFQNLSLKMEEGDAKDEVCSNKMFYLAVPPNMYEGIFKNISLSGLTVPCAQGVSNLENAWTRVLVEKPFGKDLEQAERLDGLLGELFDESQIFRIDHYLAKETVQSILKFRFEHEGFGSLWNKEHIDRVRILFHESGDVSGRGEFYDGLGALRDVGQNHMLQMLALVAMQPPDLSSKEEMQKGRQKILEEIVLTESAIVVRAQYDGYLEEPRVNSGSETETFFRVELGIDNDQWRGVPFELESGKALDKSEVVIQVYFKDAHARLEFLISSTRGVSYDAYEKVLLDCISGDQTLFASTKEIMAEWRIITKILKLWQSTPLLSHKKGARAEEIK